MTQRTQRTKAIDWEPTEAERAERDGARRMQTALRQWGQSAIWIPNLTDEARAHQEMVATIRANIIRQETRIRSGIAGADPAFICREREILERMRTRATLAEKRAGELLDQVARLQANCYLIDQWLGANTRPEQRRALRMYYGRSYTWLTISFTVGRSEASLRRDDRDIRLRMWRNIGGQIVPTFTY